MDNVEFAIRPTPFGTDAQQSRALHSSAFNRYRANGHSNAAREPAWGPSAEMNIGSRPEELTEQYRASFNAERTARYHAARRGFFESVHRWTLFAIVVFGTAGVSNFLTALGARYGIDAGVLAAITAALGAANLAFDPAGRARLHEALQRKAYDLCGEIDGTVSPTEVDSARWREKLHKIFADEPPPKRALDAIVYNATLSGRRENPDEDLVVITLFQRAMKQVLPFANAKFPRRGETKDRAAA